MRALHKHKPTPGGDGGDTNDPVKGQTPEGALEWGYQRLTESLSDEILEKIASCSASFFETLVVELLVKMNYGGSFKEAAQIVGKSGDAGVDGIIKQDRLGLDTIHVQAKRWGSVVSRPEIQKIDSDYFSKE